MTPGAEVVWNQDPTISGPVWQSVTNGPALSALWHKGCGCVVRPQMPELKWLSENMKANIPQT